MTTQQVAFIRNRNRRLARQLMQTVGAWATGLVVEAGEFVTVDNGQTLLLAQSNGTTGATIPTGPSYADSVAWSWASAQQLLAFRYSPNGVPQP
jgi:hypothetical protein